jgi:hypothetical protein
VVRDLGLYNSFAGIILPAVLTATGCFMFRQFFLTVPDELVEAARIDGARELSIFLRIMVPLSRPIMLTLAILSFQWRWNDYIWPLLMLNDPNKFTVQIGIQSHRRRAEHQLVGAARRFGHLDDPADPHLPGLPALRHERRHQRRTEGLTGAHPARPRVRPRGGRRRRPVRPPRWRPAPTRNPPVCRTVVWRAG